MRARPVTSPRRLLGTLAAAGAVLTLAACGGGSDAGAPEASGSPSTGSSTGSASEGAFPVTIDSALGEATIEEAPQRVVTVGWAAQDAAVALGVTPVGIPTDAWSGDAEGYQPWFREAVEDDGGDLPTTYADLPTVDVEAIVEMEPDVVLAPLSGLDQGVYDQLSAFAPVVAYPDGPWISTWQEVIDLTGQALGKPDEAAELVASVEDMITGAGAENGDLAGKTFAYAYIGEPGQLAFYPETDARVSFLTSLGMELAPSVAALEIPEGSFYASISLENADVLDDVDVLISWYNSPEEQAAAESQPLFAQIPAVQRGSYLPMVDRQLAAATTVVTPLSVPWAIDRYVPLVAEAAAKA
ncbi:iron-siderophore ABC transporter substrate-binding protein [Cellulomonas aerilata]|uniref:Iron-siderophore ABC transporter substrate-binding protein n=1 Tax=Cellulomonas aerilata TaxID=515326 RepID=A0A512D728_9CELL|nr:iron-siderophore ABC transporter substrate-binding protein [Cellulomonas aerilata]GEO32281.1 iron-siderophore ABC transporter substrate-binding protein [Cellulomonas aerilata]